MSLLRTLKSYPALAIPDCSSVCKGGNLLWDGGYHAMCSCCLRIGPVSMMVGGHHPPKPPRRVFGGARLVMGLHL